jgi:hypothetical protein
MTAKSPRAPQQPRAPWATNLAMLRSELEAGVKRDHARRAIGA